MKITFLGGADEVGASCTLVEIAGKRLLVDAGIRINPRPQRDIESSQLPDLSCITQLGGIDYVLVTHAHTDHTGALPLVLTAYPSVPVLMTRPTEALVRVLQQDAQRIMSSHYEEEGELPLYDEVAVEHLMQAVQIVEYNRQVRLGEGLGVTFHVSGHIAGAAMLVIDSVEGTLVMSGDVSKSPQRTVNSVRVPRLKADVLVLESTYGGRLHANREAEERRLIESLKRVIERGGRVLIPAFALGRAQEILQIILAYRDQIDARVYVDGMVRSVCQAYASFVDLLPEAMVSAAKGQPLFFRKDIHPVLSMPQRQALARDATPCIIVASSGMLTGGASQFYAQHLLPDANSAIFLTGYQDEEAPGKLLQKMMKERERGEGSIRLGKQTVSVRAEVGTYSLSAHADESELIALTRALKPEEVLLVHGDSSARESLANSLRQRQIAVALPRIGSVHEYHFGQRPWALVEQVTAHGEDREFDPAALWEAMRSNAGSYYSVAELAQRWYGSAGQTREAAQALAAQNGLYFSSDWKNPNSYRVNTLEQVARGLRQRAIMAAHPGLQGQLIAFRSGQHDVEIGVVESVTEAGFTLGMSTSQGRQYTADRLLWALGPWDASEDEAALHALLREAKRLKPQAAQAVGHRVGQPVLPHAHLAPDMPATERRLHTLAAVLALAEQGAEWQPEGLVAREVTAHAALEQNEARSVVMSLFPPEAQLRKVGLNPQRRAMTLGFDFPDVAATTYQTLIAEAAARTGWSVTVDKTVNQEALVSMVSVLLPEGATLVKRPSYFMDRREVSAEILNLDDPPALAARYEALTGFRLLINQKKPPEAIHSAPTGTLMEINSAYSRIRAALEPLGLYRAGLRGSEIVLYFISPQKGQRALDTIHALSQETGYPLVIHDQPNQQAITAEVKRYAERHGYLIKKGPGIRTAEARISLTLSSALNSEEAAAFQAAVLDATGYELDITTS
ncbi:MBL fold metallo-hydrolase (plasmid) [Aggregatilineales bacterium SYSU G02658]